LPPEGMDFGKREQAMSKTGSNASVVRAMFDAFCGDRRDEMEKLLADGFTFTSPYDDAIGREAYFKRCWPNNKRVADFQIERVTEDSDGAFVTYLFTTTEGMAFRNTEYMTIANGQVTKVDVYFGANYRDGKFVVQS
jgi:ketosteroid isomerase-like protein